MQSALLRRAKNSVRSIAVVTPAVLIVADNTTFVVAIATVQNWVKNLLTWI